MSFIDAASSWGLLGALFVVSLVIEPTWDFRSIVLGIYINYYTDFGIPVVVGETIKHWR